MGKRIIVYGASVIGVSDLSIQKDIEIKKIITNIISLTVAAHFKEKFKALTLTRGQSATLTCRAVGEKPMKISWSKDKHPFNPSFEPRYVIIFYYSS